MNRPASLPATLTAARGDTPALTILLPHARYEQSLAGLLQWTAKGAHLLGDDAGLREGATVGIDAPMSWPTSAVALAAWWLGITVVLDADGDITVRHERRGKRNADFWIGDGLDGGPTVPADNGESWPQIAQLFPDQPPPAIATDSVLLRWQPSQRDQAFAAAEGSLAAPHEYTASQLLDLAHTQGSRRAAIDVASAAVSPPEALVATALRPFVTGWATVIVDGVPRSAAQQERITTWIGDA